VPTSRCAGFELTADLPTHLLLALPARCTLYPFQ
jgi:hypothetical protein